MPHGVVNRRTLNIGLWVVDYFIAIWLLGFSIGVPLCAFLQLKCGAREKWFVSIVLTACAWAFIYGIFDRVLHVPFPEGQLLLWLGLVS